MTTRDDAVIAAAQWLHQWTQRGGVTGWLLRWALPSACLEHFNATLREFGE